MSFGANTTDPYVQLGNSGLFVYRVSLGSMQFGWSADEAMSHTVMDAYANRGGNFIDTADCYSSWAGVMGGPENPGGVSEKIIGHWLKQRGNREDIVLATKVRAEENAENRISEKNWEIIEKVIEVAEQSDSTPAQVAINWLRAKPWVSAPILGANPPKQLHELMDGLDNELNATQIAELDKVSDFARSRTSLEQ